ncbi:low affinity immunoglobulin epsilon Fc receptor-like [Ruditapes philippinarum]|uniref:low affinity immunoglobulin epsilon Fc receptor-like n=1 Tax=Ruditapes philippinarum TaxID=129788 RepID=UPI00295BCAFB|nr:low affinity immunoglobulin epsilon Fc receptor-like [Ruditapes philippinarum]
MLNLTGYIVNYLCFLLLCVLMVNGIPLRGRVDIIEKRIGVVETRMNSDNELAREMFLSLQQNFEDINSSMITRKNQKCPIMDQRGVKEDQSDSENNVEILQSSRVMMTLGLKREKQWTRDQVKILSTQMGEHSDRLDRQFLNLTNQIHLHNDELTKNYSKLRTDTIDKAEREKQWTKDQVKNLTSQVHEQTDQLNNNFSELRTELIGVNEEIKSDIYLKINKTDMLISSQQKEIEALKETQTNLLNALMSTNVVKYDYTCPSDWKKYSSYCYLFPKDRMKFDEARAYCKRLEATLPDIENQAENSFIADYLNDYSYFAWIGYSDEEKEGTWISGRTGQPASFTNFADGHSNGGIGGNCAGISPWGGKWYALNPQSEQIVVCKKDATMEFKL